MRTESGSNLRNQLDDLPIRQPILHHMFELYSIYIYTPMFMSYCLNSYSFPTGKFNNQYKSLPDVAPAMVTQQITTLSEERRINRSANTPSRNMNIV